MGSSPDRAAAWILVGTFLQAACSQEAPVSIEPTEGLRPNQESAPETWAEELDCRYELFIPGQPEGVRFVDLDGDGIQELAAVSQGASPGRGCLALWTSVLATPRLLDLPDYPLGPLPASSGHLWVASRASNELLLLAPLAADDERILRRIQLPGRPRAMGLVSGDALAVATGAGQLIICREVGAPEIHEPEIHELGIQAPTFVAAKDEQILVGSQATGGVNVYAREGEQMVLRESIDLEGIPRAYWRGTLQGQALEVLASGERELWHTSGQGWSSTDRGGAIPLRLSGGAPGELFGLSFYDLTWHRYGYDGQLQVLDSGYAGQDVWDLASGDLNADGLRDLAIANRGAHRISVLFGRKDASLRSAQILPAGGGPHSLASGDIDGDGHLDLVSIDALDDRLSYHLGDGNGNFTRSTEQPLTAKAGDRARLADLDGDGDLELIHRVEVAGEAGLRVWLGNAAESPGSLPQTSIEVRTGGSVGDLLLADLNGDTRPEILAADPVQACIHLFAWDSETGSLSPMGKLDLGGSPNALATLPAGPGGAPRLAVALGGTGARKGVAWFHFDSTTGDFIEAGFCPLEHEPIDLQSARIQGGHELLVLGRPSGADGPGRLLRMHATPTGWTPGESLTTGTRPFALATGDLNADGLDEVVIG
ncbi:MAG: hypothetical protein ACI8QC_000891, partial [Planctomycetota bacterium]